MTRNLEVKKQEEGKRLDVFLKSYFPEISREKVKRGILSNNVFVDDELVDDPSYRVKAGQTVEADIDIKPFKLVPEDIDLEKVYEDDNFIAINKPVGLVVHPGAGIKSGTLANALISHYPGIKDIGDPTRPGIIHRLDKDTSGIILVAKNKEAFEYGKFLFKDRKIKKEYKTLLYGRIDELHGIIEKPLALVPERQRVEVSEKGKPAKTEYWVEGYYGSKSDDGDGKEVDIYTLIRVILHTGRTHQIRVHFSSINHPVAGDDLYGTGFNPPKGLNRQFLHAARLQFKSLDGTFLDLRAPLPEDLQRVLEDLEISN